MVGDYNNNKTLDAGDLDLQAKVMSGQPGGPEYDLNKDGKVDFTDREIWCHDLKKTWVGDANLDQVFDSNDFVKVFVAGKYETQQAAGWEEGDWSGDQLFDSNDFVSAFLDGGYEIGQRPAAVSAVPEPGSVILALIGLLGLAGLAAVVRSSRILPWVLENSKAFRRFPEGLCRCLLLGEQGLAGFPAGSHLRLAVIAA